MGSFLPSSDAGLLAWSLNFKTQITATPTAFGLTAAQATAYGALHDAYATALAVTSDPATRTRPAIATKDSARTSLKNNARLLSKIVQATATVTNAQKFSLGLNVRTSPSPVPAPSDAPVLEVASVVAWTASIRLHDASSATKRGRPAGVNGAAVFSYVGATAPTDLNDWHFEGNTGKTTVNISFSNALAPGAKVWLTAFWFNARKESGPACTPVGANLPGGSVSSAM